MSGVMIVAAGIGMMVLSAALFAVSIVYRRTAGRKIREELKREYE